MTGLTIPPATKKYACVCVNRCFYVLLDTSVAEPKHTNALKLKHLAHYLASSHLTLLCNHSVYTKKQLRCYYLRCVFVLRQTSKHQSIHQEIFKKVLLHILKFITNAKKKIPKQSC